jgi:peptide/nickel transport system substrate-binding protein
VRYLHVMRLKSIKKGVFMRKVGWLLLMLLLIAAMVLASCGKNETTTTGGTTTITGSTTTTPTPGTTIPSTPPTSAPEKPQYGGVYHALAITDIAYFDDTVGNLAYCASLGYTQEELLQGDWAKGMAGTGEAQWTLPGTNRIDQKAGCLAESWDIPQPGTIIFHIRKGVHWASLTSAAGLLVNGRELTVDDIVFSLNRAFTTKGAYFTTSYPGLAKGAVVTGDSSAWTVTVTCPTDEWVNCINLVPDYLTIVPREVVNKYGNMQDWKNSVGTGPFILTDFISNSSATFIKNPNYWGTNPVGPGKGDQLPYVDKVQMMIIVDQSTRISAFRTGKLDIMGDTATNRNLVGSLLDDPTLKINAFRYLYDGCYLLGMRTDMPDSPFSNKDVRQAIMLALNLNAIKNYYKGDSELEVWPIAPPPKEYEGVYVPLNELPANVQALYNGPDVETAKSLLAEAGYGNGFTVNVITYNTPVFLDILSSFQADLAKVNITLKIEAKDYATWMGRLISRNYGAYDMLWSSTAGIGTYQRMINFRGSGTYNASYINDSVVEQAYQEMMKYVGIDEAKCQQINHDLMPYLLEQAYVIPVPAAYLYKLWWPWMKDYHGETSVGYYNIGYIKYFWIDQNLRDQMTGR